jgi:hypothetical protein
MRRSWRPFIQPDNAIRTNRNGSRRRVIAQATLSLSQKCTYLDLPFVSVGSNFRTLQGRSTWGRPWSYSRRATTSASMSRHSRQGSVALRIWGRRAIVWVPIGTEDPISFGWGVPMWTLGAGGDLSPRVWKPGSEQTLASGLPAYTLGVSG